MAYEHRVSRTYQLEPDTAQRIQELAVRLGSYTSPLVDLLLRRALDEVEAGRWELQREPVKYNILWREE